jgi:hypothetical protein
MRPYVACTTLFLLSSTSQYVNELFTESVSGNADNTHLHEYYPLR